MTINVDKNIKTLDAIRDLRKSLRAEESRKRKIRILKATLEESQSLCRLIRTVYHPDWMYGIRSEDVSNIEHGVQLDEALRIYEALKNIKNISSRASKKTIWRTVLADLSESYRTTANRLLDKDLKCGITVEDVNEALRQLDHEEIPTSTVTEPSAVKTFGPENKPIVELELYYLNDDYTSGSFLVKGLKVGSVTFSKHMLGDTYRILELMGIKVTKDQFSYNNAMIGKSKGKSKK